MNKDKRNNIKLLGTLTNADESGIIANANQIYDDVQQKDQETINSELIAAAGTGGSVDTRITNAVNVEKTRAEGAESALDGKITAEQTRAANAENALDGRVDTLEEAVGTGGSVDSRIASAIAAETSRAQEAEANRYTKNETYTKEEVNNLITTPNQGYVSVAATDQTTAVTDVLPAIGLADTIYRVGNWDGSQYDVTKYSEYAWNSSGYVFLAAKSSVGEVFDISEYHAGTKYANLAAALGTNGKNIPQSLRKGGMSVKFVQSSDNKYVRYNLLADSFTTDTTKWAIDDAGVYVENPEWIYVLLDAEKRILAGLKSDGSIEWSIGVPTPVKTYIDNAINEIKNGTEGTDLDGLNKIIAFLSEFSTSDTLKDLLNTKVDKEEGKSLIDAEYANGVHYVENPEFAGVWLDNDEHILFGIEQDGNFLFGCGVPKQVKKYIEQKIEELSLDEYESIVTFIGDYLNNTTLEELLSKKVDGEYVENPEYIDAKVDNEDKILEATEKDGTKVFGGDVKVLGSIDISGVSYKVVSNSEWLEVVLDSEDRIICGIKTNGKFVVYVADFLDDIEAIKTRLKELDAYNVTENPEFMEVKLDSDDKVLSGRKIDGTKVEFNPIVFSEAAGNTLNLDNLNLSKEGLEQLSGDLGIQGIHEYPCVRDAAKDNQIGIIKVGSELYASVVSTPSELTHKQDALPYFYYDANSTLSQYKTIGSRIAIPENICNKVEQEEIDFTPSETGKTRTIVGKSSNDVFFVSKTNCNYGEGVPDTQSKENCLETTTDFVTFTPLFKAHNSQTIVGGLSIADYGAISIYSVKEFANGDFIVAGHCWYDGGGKTCFFLLKKDFSAITPITCTYLDGTTGLMMDEFSNSIYDWHIAISGSKALVTTYGNRQPATDYGRVWYTEDNGVTWKQIFQMTNHYQDGVAPGDPAVTQVHIHGVMIDEYDDKLFVIAGEDNANLFWSDKGWDTTDDDWNVIPIRRELPLQQQTYMQVVNGYAFATNLIFGSDCVGAGAIYRLNKLGKDSYSEIQVAHEFLPNKFSSTMYCGAGMYRRDNHTPLFFCETRENCMLTEELNEILEESHKARVVATYDGINFTEIWTDDTFGTHETYISNEGITTRKFSYCGRDMNFYLLKNGDAVIKYIGRKYNYFGGDPMYSVQGNTKGCCKVRWIKNIEQYL